MSIGSLASVFQTHSMINNPIIPPTGNQSFQNIGSLQNNSNQDFPKL